MSTGAAEQLDRARSVIAELRKKILALQAGTTDSVAVVGMACRFPGEARDCEGYWRMIAAGGSAVRPAPAQRARDLGVGSTKPTALLDDIESFDAAFFEISPREAARMDPQQRLFLEVAWEALEDAGQTRPRLAGSPTGVFVGVHNLSGGYLELQTAGDGNLNEYTPTGAGHDVIAGRLAYLFDLRGPSAAINTACSSSLVAIHMACQSLLTRDCRMAVAGGVNLLLGPKQNEVMHLGAMLAPDGRCKTFDARANGYGRGEGCGVVVLKRLSDAVADRDRILAVIRGSAINQDGRTNGLTAPNGLAQQDLLRSALQRAGLDAARIGYVETHGTGTALGDPIEVEALAAVYGAPAVGAGRCFLGSAKANINHLEGAAGIAGLIRAIMVLRAGRIPPVAGLEQLNPHFSLEGSRLSIPAAPVEWQSDLPRIAGVSAFGWSGVNCHVIVEEPPVQQTPATMRPSMMLVSASDPSALAARASMLADELERLPDETLESFAWTATGRRSQYACRLAVAGDTRSELVEALRTAAAREQNEAKKSPVVAGLLIGDDSQSVSALGGELFAQEPVFKSAVDACATAFAAAGHDGVAAALKRGFESADGQAQLLVNARLLAFAVGVNALLSSWGVRAVKIAGFGAGTVAAEHLRGEITLPDAVQRASRDQQAGMAGTAANTQLAAAIAQLTRGGVTHTVRVDGLVSDGSGRESRRSARSRLMRILADLAAAGADLTWDAIYAREARVVSLPAHRFRRRRHWITEAAAPVATQTTPTGTQTTPIGAQTTPVEAPATRVGARATPVATPVPLDSPASPESAYVPSPVPTDWFFETRWQSTSLLSPVGASASARNWLILGAPNGAAERLADSVRRDFKAGTVEIVSDLNAESPRNVASREVSTLVDLRALDPRHGPVATQAMQLARQVVELNKWLDEIPPQRSPRIWIATRGAQQVLASEPLDLAAAPLWGLARSLVLDQPDRWGGVVDLDPGVAFEAELLCREIAAGVGAADEVAFRGGARYVNRLARVTALSEDTLRLSSAATYLVTGAFGDIGPTLAEWLARRGATSLVLAGRSVELSDTQHSSIALKRRLREMGVEATIERCDVSDRASVAALFERLRQIGKPLKGIFHAAAAATTPVATIENSDLVAAFRPKVDGSLLLDEYSRAFDLDLFVLFSSAAGVLGARGQGHYAGANAFLDALAVSRRAEALPGLSVDWGLWGTEGASHVPYFQRVGLNPMAPDTALDAMAQLVSTQASGRHFQPLVASLDGDRLRAALELRGRGAFLSNLSPASAVRESPEISAFVAQLRGTQVALRKGVLADAIAGQVRTVMELAPDDLLDKERGFFDLGMDSLMTVALKARLEELFGVSLPSTLAMDYPSVAALTDYFTTLLADERASDQPANARPVATVPMQADPPQAAMRAPEELGDDEVGDALAAELRALELELQE